VSPGLSALCGGASQRPPTHYFGGLLGQSGSDFTNSFRVSSICARVRRPASRAFPEAQTE